MGGDGETAAGASAPRGAYGLTLPDMPGQQWLGPAPASWPAWSVLRGEVEASDQQELSDDHAVLHSLSGSVLRVDRATSTTTLAAGSGDPDAALVHPLLAVTGIVHAEWSGRLAFHGGAFLDEHGGAWGVLGDRQDGKSSVLAWMAAAGVGVVADDLLVTDGECLLAGPRCLDLRESSAEHFGIGENIGIIGRRERYRVGLPPIEPQVPLRGWVVLQWDDTIAIDDVGVADRARILQLHRALKIGQRSPAAWLDVLALPMVHLRRPRRWDAGDAAIERLLTWTAGR
jgi:hypothetical protein